MYLIDTNIISELAKPLSRANPGVLAWAEKANQARTHLSVITIEEIETGVIRKEQMDPSQGARLRMWMNTLLLQFRDRILPYGLVEAQTSAHWQAARPLPVNDARIAATALTHQLTVVTHNTRDFVSFSVPLFDPWSEL